MNKNNSWFTILELLISFIILFFVIFSISHVINNTILFYSFKQNENFINYNISDIKNNITDFLKNCKNKDIAFSWRDFSFKDNFKNDENIYYDKLELSCDNNNLIFQTYDKKDNLPLKNFLKSSSWAYFSIKDNTNFYINKNLNILNFTFEIITFESKNFVKLHFTYDNNIDSEENKYFKNKFIYLFKLK